MSRAEHHTTTRRRVLAGLVPSVLGLGLAAVLTGCGAGQITQTDTQQAAVNGANASVGPIALRDVELAPPDNQQAVYAPGSSAALIITIVNAGLHDDTLVKVTSPAVESITIDGSATGSKLIPGGFAVASGQDPDDMTVGASSGGPMPTTSTPTSTTSSPSTVPTSTTSPSTPPSSGAVGVPSGSVQPTQSSAAAPPGKITITLVGIKSINGASLRAGLTIPLTFYFAHAGQVTVPQVPIAALPDTPAVRSAANG